MSLKGERTTICPTCGKTVAYVRPELIERFANGGTITVGEGILIIFRQKWINHFGRKYVCPECGKTWHAR